MSVSSAKTDLSNAEPEAGMRSHDQACPGSRPELLAPAGDWECARAAVENGADAIYFGLEKFNARMRAHNFTEADLPRLMEFLHRRGVKGYVTFNTLVFENELAEAEDYLRVMISAGVDAAIVQDVGICRLIRQLSPEFPIHVSTQMTVTSAGGIEFARELGCNLVVLARECSLKEIESIRKAAQMPLEVFVHGALCVAYSGQCLTSEALGGRSANRGECAQACRMPYELLKDGELLPLGDRKYLLSPQDLAGVELVPELARVGVASLKVEGRLKSPEYVANITRIYRDALDRLTSKAAPDSKPSGAGRLYEMEMAFSRGLYSGWFRGINNQELVHARFGKKRGVYLGVVAEVEGESVLLRLEGPLKAGDGVVFDAGHPEEKEEGGRVYEIKAAKRHRHGAPNHRLAHQGDPPLSRLSFKYGALDFKNIRPGDKVWKTSDPELDRRLRQSFEGESPKCLSALSFEVQGSAGTSLTVLARDELGHIARLNSAMPLQTAERQPLTTERLREQLGRLGGTPFKLGELKNQLEADVVLPISELNRLRRELVCELESQRAKPPVWQLRAEPEVRKPGVRPSSGAAITAAASEPTVSCNSEISGLAAPEDGRTPVAPQLVVLVRNLEQLETAVEAGARTLYCEFEDPKKYRAAVERFREHPGHTGQHEIFVAPPRIFKTGEEWILNQVRSCNADGYLVRNYDHLKFFTGERCIGDYSLNVANHLSAEYFKTKFRLQRLTASYDLNFLQLEALLKGAPPEWFEVTIHQHMPMFHMEHCVFCAFLSQGTDYSNCGRPCDKHDLKLRDRVGKEHPVKADVGCRNTVFNALAQTGAEYVEHLLVLGVRCFRLEFLNETGSEVKKTIASYEKLLRGEIEGQQLWRELKLLNQLGVTRGQMGSLNKR